jgi:hypothetical protein
MAYSAAQLTQRINGPVHTGATAGPFWASDDPYRHPSWPPPPRRPWTESARAARVHERMQRAIAALARLATPGPGRLANAAEVMPARAYRECAKREVRAPLQVFPIRKQVRRDRCPGGERRRRPRCTFLARFCTHRRRL